MSTAIDSDAYTSMQHMCMCACRVLPSVCPKRKTVKAGSRVNPSSLMVYVVERLRTTAEGTEAPLSAAEGILAGLNKHASMLASVGTREGIDDLLTKIAPLTAAIELGKMVRCDCVRDLPTHEPSVVTLYSIYICV